MNIKNLNETIGIKINTTQVEAKVLMYLKKKTGRSISEIKRTLNEYDYVFQCECCDDEGLHLINQMKLELKSLGADVTLFELGHEVPSNMLDNLEKMHQEINEDCENYPD